MVLYGRCCGMAVSSLQVQGVFESVLDCGVGEGTRWPRTWKALVLMHVLYLSILAKHSMFHKDMNVRTRGARDCQQSGRHCTGPYTT